MDVNSDCTEIERKLSGFIFELHDKRLELSGLKTKYQESLIRIQDLELDLDRERKKSTETKIQLEVAIKASERCETKRVTLREQVAAQAISGEAAVKERDYLRQQNRHLNSQVSKLRSEAEQSQNRVRDLISSVDNFKEKLNQNNTELEALNKQVNLLEQDGSKVKTILERTNEFCNQVVKRVTLQSKSVRQTIAERDSFKQQLYQLQGEFEEELSKRARFDSQDSSKVVAFQTEQWKDVEEVYKQKLCIKEEEIRNMELALAASLNSYKSLQAQHKELKTLYSQVEEELKKAREVSHPTVTDAAVNTSCLQEEISHENSLNQNISECTQ